MPSSHAHHLFLPWLRQGLTSAIQQEDTLGAGVPGRLALPVRLKTRADNQEYSTNTVTVRFYGPGDVLGIDPHTIVRTEPRPRFPNFESNLFPFIEFDRPDFPWLFTPARANAEGQLRPWLCLVVVPRDDSVRLGVEPRRPLPVLTCRRGDLPPLADSWAWAHTQLTRLGIPQEPPIESLLRDYPERTLSRIISPRRLLPGQDYLACLVPAFAAGRKAGMGEPLTAADEAELTPAWDDPLVEPDTQEKLPVYYHWEFTTGAAGDFEALTRRLKVRSLPGDVGVQRVDMHAPGWGLPNRDIEAPGAILEMGGVLVTPNTDVAEWDAQAQAEFVENLQEIINAPAESEGSPLVKPPLYGQEYVRMAELPADNAPPHWFRELNLDPRYRIAAGLGAMVIRYEQERLMAEAWKQLAAATAGVEAQRRQQFSNTISSALTAKHLSALSIPAPAEAGFRSLEGGDTPALVLISPANGSLARRLQLRGQVAADAGAPVMNAFTAEATRSATEAPLADESFRFAPTFAQPVMEWLRDYFAFMLMPGLSQVPPNTIALLESDPALIEAFMVGMNHEMGRELLWREFPVNQRGTYFRNFWSATSEISPIDEWAPTSHLGDHLIGGTATTPPDPALDAQIQVVQDELHTLTTALNALENEIAAITQERATLMITGEPIHTQWELLLIKQGRLDTRQGDLLLAQQAGPAWDEIAATATAAATALRAGIADVLVQLEALEHIAAQIPQVEANRQAVLSQIADLTSQIEGIPALEVQLTNQRTTAETARTTARDRLRQIQTEVATIPDLQSQVAAAEHEAADHERQGLEERLQGDAINAQADPQRIRLEELAGIERRALELKDVIDALRHQIMAQERIIADHRAREPFPRPDDGPGHPPDERVVPEADTNVRAPISPLPGPGIPYDDWYEWERQLRDLLEQLGYLQRELEAAEVKLGEYQQELEEVPVLRDQVAQIEAQAAVYYQRSDAAYHSAYLATERAISLRSRIATIQDQARQIPTLETEIQNRTADIEALITQINGLPDYQLSLETARADAEAQIPILETQIAELQAQVADIPTLQAQIGPIRSEAEAQDAIAAAAQQAAAAARASIGTLTAEIAQLQSDLAPLPGVVAAVQANDNAVNALTTTLTEKQHQFTAQRNLRAIQQAEVEALRNERTMHQSQLVLLIRGELLRRFGRARIYAVEGDGDAPGDNELQPLFHQTIGQDMTLLGFGITGAVARGTNGHPGWYFVIEEPPTDVRFGLDVAEGERRAVEAIPAWDALTWDDVADNEAALAELAYLSIGGRLADKTKPLFTEGISINAKWGRNSAHMALITRQQPIRMIIHASTWLS